MESGASERPTTFWCGRPRAALHAHESAIGAPASAARMTSSSSGASATMAAPGQCVGRGKFSDDERKEARRVRCLPEAGRALSARNSSVRCVCRSPACIVLLQGSRGPPSPSSARSHAAGVAQLPSGSGAAPVSGAGPGDDGDSADGSAAAAAAQPRRPGAPRGTSRNRTLTQARTPRAASAAQTTALGARAWTAMPRPQPRRTRQPQSSARPTARGSAPDDDAPGNASPLLAAERSLRCPGQCIAAERSLRCPPSLVSRSSLPPRPCRPAGSAAESLAAPYRLNFYGLKIGSSVLEHKCVKFTLFQDPFPYLEP